MDKSTSLGTLLFCNLIGIVFIILKLCKVVSWSWLWVLSPFWITAVFFGLALFGNLLITKWLGE